MSSGRDTGLLHDRMSWLMHVAHFSGVRALDAKLFMTSIPIGDFASYRHDSCTLVMLQLRGVVLPFLFVLLYRSVA
jgi:predicted RNA-binding protein with PUA-like domain